MVYNAYKSAMYVMLSIEAANLDLTCGIFRYARYELTSNAPWADVYPASSQRNAFTSIFEDQLRKQYKAPQETASTITAIATPQVRHQSLCSSQLTRKRS